MFLNSYFGCTNKLKWYSVTKTNIFFCYKLNDLKLFIFVGHVSEQECNKNLRLIKS